MKFSSSLTAQSLAFASVLIFAGTGTSHAQPIQGRPAQGSTGAIIGNPPPKQGDARPTQPDYPNTDPMLRRDPIREGLNRTNREAADIDRDGIISPAEASRIPPGPPR
jgi:hypothetical protein